MTDPTPDAQHARPAQAPGERQIPGERRLARPPSDRYLPLEPESPAQGTPASPSRGVALGILAALAVAVAITLLGGVLALSAGLLVVAAAGGWVVAGAVRTGARDRIATSRRVRLSIGLALAAVAFGQIGLWLYAVLEGGVLAPLDYLGETFGALVPLELAIAGLIAWAAAR